MSPFHWGEPQLSLHGASVVVVVAFSLGSRHRHSLQYWVFTSSPQQSPPSHSHPQLLFSSSHQSSPFQLGEPQDPVHPEGGGVGVGLGGVGVGEPPHTLSISAIERILKYYDMDFWAANNFFWQNIC